MQPLVHSLPLAAEAQQRQPFGAIYSETNFSYLKVIRSRGWAFVFFAHRTSLGVSAKELAVRGGCP